MKNIFLICITLLISTLFSKAQKFNYELKWELVDSLEAKQLPKSEATIIDEIYKNAKVENNTAQLVRSIIYKMKVNQSTQEDDQVRNIEFLEKELQASLFPLKQILSSLLADMYWQYYQNNRYNIQERSETSGFEKKDIKTWDLKSFIIKIEYLYELSLTANERSKKVNIEKFQYILDNLNKETALNKPTLFDFLSHRAIDFYTNSEAGLTKPVEEFNINDEKYFLPSDQFVKLNINSNDSLSFNYNAIKLLQDLVKFHIKDTNPEALIDAELKRYEYIYDNLTAEQKDSLYLRNLENLKSKCSGKKSEAYVELRIIQKLFDIGNSFIQGEPENKKWLIKTAREKCIALAKKFEFVSDQCMNFIAKIDCKNLTLTIEDENLPGEPFRALAKYKNIDSVYLRIYKTNYQQLEQVTELYNNYIQKIYCQQDTFIINYFKDRKPLTSYSAFVPRDSDYQNHAAEIKINSLEKGLYFIMAGTSEKMDFNREAVTYGLTSITEISYISRQNETGGNDFYVLHRKTGKPLKGVQAICKTYNYYNEKEKTKKVGTFVSDSAGLIKISASEIIDKAYSVTFILNDDIWSPNENQNFYPSFPFYNYQYNNEKYKTNRIFFFTDRAIYRPGQTIYFKGIVVSSDGWKNNKIVPNFTANIVLKDVNWQNTESVTVTSNEYGSFNGSFTAPDKGLNGLMTIYSEFGSAQIHVEEYKRPKFEVKFDTIRSTFKLGQMLKVNGKAISYSGTNIDNATVSYRVVRQTRYPLWKDWWWFPRPQIPDKVITNGTTKTDENGTFEINFLAVPDNNAAPSTSPIFDFKIYADVIDINGETHSNTQTISIGYKALMISTNIPGKLDKNNVSTFSIKTENSAGNFVPASGKISIYHLKGPDKVFRPRKWEKPDKFALSKEEFYRNFPTDIYDDENNFSKWPVTEQVFDLLFDTKNSKDFNLDNINTWKDGVYKIVVQSKDTFSSKVEETYYFTLYDKKNKQTPVITDDWYYITKDSGEPGENIELLSGTAYDNIHVMIETECDNKITSSKWIEINNEQKIQQIPITEEYRGNFGIHYTFIKNNRLYAHNENIIVPYSNKKLDIKFETFRNKLQPGEKEQWKLRISGKDGDKVAAEMVATLYDASLDAFTNNTFKFSIYPYYYLSMNWTSNYSFNASTYFLVNYNQKCMYSLDFDNDEYYLKWYIPVYHIYENKAILYSMSSSDEVSMMKEEDSGYKSAPLRKAYKDGQVHALASEMEAAPVETNDEPIDLSIVSARTNFNETAFFYPNLQTNENSEVIINFTIPEALTKWKMLGFAHTKDLKYGFAENELITQKELMVVPNAPRFFREGDTINFSAKITSLTGESPSGSAQLMLFDANTMKPIDKELGNISTNQNFSITESGSTNLTWQLIIPQGIQAITYRIVAQSGKFSDGEEMTLPVFTNRMLVTESMTITVKGKQTSTRTMDKFANNTSPTLRNYKLTFEYTQNPAWYAIQALPYLMEYPYECAEQVFSRFYANSIASHIANSNPRIKLVFDSWRNITPDALLSNLEKNQELKGLLLEETPWVLQAKDESQRKRNVALLFDLNRMGNELGRAIEKLKDMQTSNGGFPWFKGMPEDRYITQHIICGLGKLNHLGIKNLHDNKIWQITENALAYSDRKITEDYQLLLRLAKAGQVKLSDNHLNYITIHYLYTRSFFPDIIPSKETKEAIDYYLGQAKTYWTKNDLYMQGMLALALNRNNDKFTPTAILKSLKERSITSEEMGTYWKTNKGWFWYQAPIETQAMMIEAFDEVERDTASVNEMRIWLLRQKQTQDWGTTKATTEACYALLLRGTEWLSENEPDEIKIGSTKLEPFKMENVKVETGTGYFKTSWSGSDIKPEMATVTITKKSDGISWGALYWQYFEQLDKITPAETPLKLNKKLFVERPSPSGPVIILISDTTTLKSGDLIKVRIELKVDRDMEYVHMKDMRASGFEPVNVLSQYKWQEGLGYYESTRDAATNFFFSWLPKGTYVFEYPLRVSNSGKFSNGITTIQCMYAPEFTSHSEGVRVKVK